MSRKLFLNCQSGISGDMFAAALLAVGARAESLRQAVAALALGPITLDIQTTIKGPLAATVFKPVIPSGIPCRRTMAEVEDTLAKSGLPGDAVERVRSVFRALGLAEAEAHGENINEVHFHEMGHPDTLVDVVSVVAGLADLDINQVFVSAVNVGAGSVRTDHGYTPVPAPATANLLAGFEMFSDGEMAEKTTPTGAALLAAFARPGRDEAITVARVGYGAGTNEFTRSTNVLQAVLGEDTKDEPETSIILECTIDDMNPQVYPVVLSRLIGAGAQDAYLTPVHMKKGRPGTLLTVIAPPDKEDALGLIMLAETTTIGLRRWSVRRVKAARRVEIMTTPWGPVPVKVAEVGGIMRAVPEFEDCRRIAETAGLPLLEIMNRLSALAGEQFNKRE